MSESLVSAGEAIAREAAPLVDVRPYLPLEVGAIAEEALSAEALERFEAGARRKLEALGSRFVGVHRSCRRRTAPGPSDAPAPA